MIRQALPQAETVAEPERPPEPKAPELVQEVGGCEGPDPVRYGDWEKNGRCIDF